MVKEKISTLTLDNIASFFELVSYKDELGMSDVIHDDDLSHHTYIKHLSKNDVLSHHT
jgi:hypothetical protein